MISDGRTSRILLIGWDSAEWSIIRPLMNQGKLPHLTRLVDEGVSGNLRSLHPRHSPMLWTSVATGKRPHKHGICGYSEVCPDGLNVRSITSHSRRTKALWNIVSQSGMAVNCVNWYASDPAEPINGVYVARGFFSPQESAGTGRDGVSPFRGPLVYPPQIENELLQLRIDAAELNPASVLELLPAGTRVSLDHPILQPCASALAETASVHGVACHLLQHNPADLTAVLYTGLEHFSHLLMPYQPPRQSHISERDYAMYQQALSVVYQLHDMMLGRLIELAGEGMTIILVSDHGFQTGMARCDRASALSMEAAIASHDSQGILVMRGQHIVRDDTIEGVTLLDVVPTVLALLGLPTAADMDGKPMVGAFNVPLAPNTIPSWDQIECEAWDKPSEAVAQVDERLRYLIDLGYKESPTAEVRQRMEHIRQENTYNLARSLIDARETERAIPLLKSLCRREPFRHDLSKSLFEAYSETGRSDEARAVVQRFWDIGERGPLVHLGFALVSISERRPQEALDHLGQMAMSNLSIPGMQVLVGQAYLRLRKWGLAEEAFRKELTLNINNEQAWGGLAVAAAGEKQYQTAAEHALQAVGLKPDYLSAHYQLGLSLYHLGRYSEAANAFKRCLEIDPDFIAACRGLIGLYQGVLIDAEQALVYHKHAASCLKHRHLHRSPRTTPAALSVAASST